MSEQTNMAARSKTARGWRGKSSPRFASNGRNVFLFSFEFLPRTGRKAAGIWSNPSNSRNSLQPLGVDLVDCSSAGLVQDQKIVAGPGFQVPFAERIRRETGVMTGAVGLIETKEQVQEILAKNQADLVLMAREFLRDPYWPLRAARELGHKISWPAQYLRAAPPDSPARKPFDAGTPGPTEDDIELCLSAHEERARIRENMLNKARTSEGRGRRLQRNMQFRTGRGPRSRR